MSFIPSCDDARDAIRSLSGIYAVPIDKIDEVLRDSNVLEIAEEYSQINTQGFHFVVSNLLKASPRADITYACYYHSTSYSGNQSWFDEGLLGSSEGVKLFIEKIIEWVPPEKRLVTKQEIMKIVKTRSEYEGSTVEECGPYAWDTFTAASSSGARYWVPEAIQDLWSPSFCGNGALIDLSEIINKRLKPVVVKFKGTISDINDYCATLWAFLLSDDGEYHLTHTFKGKGRAIPKEDIVALMDVK